MYTIVRYFGSPWLTSLCCLQYYFNACGTRFRSRTEVAKHLGLVDTAKKVSRTDAYTKAQAAAGALEDKVPLALSSGVTVNK